MLLYIFPQTMKIVANQIGNNLNKAIQGVIIAETANSIEGFQFPDANEKKVLTIESCCIY